jgi:hypothetical protein
MGANNSVSHDPKSPVQPSGPKSYNISTATELRVSQGQAEILHIPSGTVAKVFLSPVTYSFVAAGKKQDITLDKINIKNISVRPDGTVEMV